MIVQFVKFETDLSEDEVLDAARARMEDFGALPGLLQKFYLKLEGENRFGGFYVWASMADLLAFRDSDLAKTIPDSYAVKGTPSVEVHELLFPLRDLGLVRAGTGD